MTAQVDLAEVEARIIKLCERARAQGWRFASFGTIEAGCGCALQACGQELRTDWRLAGLQLGVLPTSFGIGFDDAMRGEKTDYAYSDQSSSHYALGARIARRLMDEVTS